MLLRYKSSILLQKCVSKSVILNFWLSYSWTINGQIHEVWRQRRGVQRMCRKTIVIRSYICLVIFRFRVCCSGFSHLHYFLAYSILCVAHIHEGNRSVPFEFTCTTMSLDRYRNIVNSIL